MSASVVRLTMLRVMVAIVFVACALTQVSGDVLSDGIAINYWCGPMPDQTTAERYKEVADAGFNVAMPPCAAVNLDLNRKILDFSEQQGMKAIIADDRIMAKSPDDKDFATNLDAVIADYGSHPALYGYFLKDEPNAADFPRLGAVNQYLLEKDPKHLPYINLFPNYAGPSSLGAPNYEAYVDQYLNTVNPLMLCFDHYSQMTNYDGSQFFDNIEVIRNRALLHNIPFMVIFSVTPFDSCRNPSMGDMRWQVYTSLAYGTRGITYFTYWSQGLPLGGGVGIIDLNGNPSEHYSQVQQLNAQVKALSPTLVKLHSDAVYHVGNVPSGGRALPAGELITSVQGANAVISFFTGNQETRYVMLVNKDMQSSHTIQFTFGNMVRLCEVSHDTGTHTLVGVQQTFSLPFLAGEGRLFAVDDLQPPSVPVNVETSGLSITSIRITWCASTDNTDVAGYKVFRNGAQVGTSTTNSYMDIGLSPTTSYSYTVSAYDVAGNGSAQSSPPTIGTTLAPDSTPPRNPTNMHASGISSSSIQTNWTASTDNRGVLGYKVYRNAVQIATTGATSFTDSGLQASTTYSYTVSAYDGDGNDSAQSSPAATARTLATLTISNVVPSSYVVTTFDIGSTTYIDRSYTITSMPAQYRGYRGIRTANNDKDYASLDFHFTISTAADIYICLNENLQPNTPLLTGFVDRGGDIITNVEALSIWRKSYPAGVVSLGPKPGAGNGDSMYFVLIGYPEDTQPPSVPTNVQATAQSQTSIQVTWTASTDNIGVAGYKVSRNGSQVGTSDTTSYMDSCLSPWTVYSYTVSAFDASGNNSAQSSPPATAVATNCASVDLGSTNVNFTLAHVLNSDGDTVATTAGGLDCRKPIKSGDNYYYFVIDDGFLYNTDVTTYLEVNYYDDQTTSVYLQPQYDAVGDGIPNMYRGASNVPLTNTSKWKTATWTLTNCKFANRQNVGSDFRIYVGTGYNVKIDSVRLSKIPFSDYTNVERDLGSAEIYKGLSHPQNSDGDTVVTTIGGRDCRKCSTSGDNYMYFNVSDAMIYNGSSPTVYLRVCYYDSPGGLIQPRYDSTSNAYTTAAIVNFTGTNTWKEATWTLTNCKFANSQVVSADFSLYLGASQNVYIDKVTVSKIPFEDTVAPSVPANVQATALTPTQIKVTWTASTDLFGVAGYKVYRNSSQIGTSATTSYTDTGLSPSTTYSYTVSAYDAAGNNSAQSSPATATTPGDLQAPSVPTNVAATAPSSSSIQITWTASTDNIGVTGYKVYRDAALAGASSGTAYMDSGLAPSTTYSYTVSAYDGAGNNSAQSSPAVTAITRPAGFETLYANEDTLTYASENTITHNNLGIQARYHSIYTRYGWLEFTFGSVGMANATIYLYQYFDWGNNYSARLRGSQYDMDEATLTYFNQPSDAGSWTIIGNWNATTGARQYYSADITTFYNSHLGQKMTLRLESTTYGVYGEYYEDSEGSRLAAGDYTAPAPNYPKIEVTPDTTAPNVPSGVTAIAKSPSVIGVSWSASTDNVGVTGYKVYRDSVQVGTSATTSYTDTGLSPNMTYTYTVSAYDAAGNNSALSSPLAVATTMNPIDITTAKLLPNLSPVGLVTKIVTAIFSNCFYIEESDRNAGIKVVPIQMPAGLSTYGTVDVGGTMMTGLDGERYIGAATAVPNGE